MHMGSLSENMNNKTQEIWGLKIRILKYFEYLCILGNSIENNYLLHGFTYSKH